MSLHFLFLTWFVPIALRLSLGRGILWLVSIQLFVICAVITRSIRWADAYLAGLVLIHYVILRGHREPAIMTLGGAVAIAAVPILMLAPAVPEFVGWTVANAIYAAILLYGTDRVSPPRNSPPFP
ncbi:MAG: hypothetical protein ABI680_15455 [Chthoniobacteraceae bacterium]